MRPFSLNSCLLVLGFICLGLGIIGIFTPLLPTTPFILLAGFLFSRSSERFHKWLLHHQFFGEIIRSWEKDRIIPLKAKILALSMILFSVIVIVLLEKIPQWGKITALMFLMTLTIFLLTWPSKRKSS